MRTFFAELHEGNSDIPLHVFFDAPDLPAAMKYLEFFARGADYAYSLKIEIRSISAYKTKGRNYERLA